MAPNSHHRVLPLPYFVTSNDNKFKEVRKILNLPIKQIDLDLPEIQDLDVEKVVQEKLKTAYSQVKKPVFVEDTGLYLMAFDGFPGALIKWVLETLGQKVLCDLVQGRTRAAYAKTCVGFYDGVKIRFFVGRLAGQLSPAPRGQSRFGWDPIFIPNGFSQTFAQIGPEEKNKISMRFLAFKKFKNFLEKIRRHQRNWRV